MCHMSRVLCHVSLSGPTPSVVSSIQKIMKLEWAYYKFNHLQHTLGIILLILGHILVYHTSFYVPYLETKLVALGMALVLNSPWGVHWIKSTDHNLEQYNNFEGPLTTLKASDYQNVWLVELIGVIWIHIWSLRNYRTLKYAYASGHLLWL